MIFGTSRGCFSPYLDVTIDVLHAFKYTTWKTIDNIMRKAMEYQYNANLETVSRTDFTFIKFVKLIQKKVSVYRFLLW